MKKILKSILHFQWTKRFVYWLIVSSGTMSECAFLVASLWMILNKNVHSFFLAFMSEEATKRLTELSTMAYVGLPEIILSLAIIITIGHFRVWRSQRDFIALTWSILYGIPTVIFLFLSVVTLAFSVENVSFEVPQFMVIVRAIAGYGFGLVALLYHYIGQPQEVNRLQEKDQLINELAKKIDEERGKFSDEKASLLEKFSAQKAEMENLKLLFDEEKMRSKKLFSEIETSKEAALEALPQELSNLVKSKKSCSIEEAISVSGISKTRIQNAVKRGEIKKPTRNKELLVVSSLVEWIKNQPVLLAVNE